MTVRAPFKYTFPIVKSEQRDDGRYLVGFASGPEIDTHGERIAPEAIERFAQQINSTNGMPLTDRLVYRDAHAPDGVLRDLGYVTKAWVTENFHLGIEVRLDEDNPASDYLWKSTQKGKQFGMSVSGVVLDYADIPEGGTLVRTFKHVVLDEISNTTRPAWYPSFGTVLSKSIKDASSDANGENPVKKGPNGELLDDDAKDATTDKSADDTSSAADDSTQKADDAADDAATTDKSDDAATTGDIDKAGRKVSGTTAATLLGLFDQMKGALEGIGVLDAAPADTTADKSASGDADKTVDKTAGDSTDEMETLKSQVAVLTESLTKATGRIAELEASPRTTLPPVITDVKKSQDEFAELMQKADPSEKLRLAFAAHTSGK